MQIEKASYSTDTKNLSQLKLKQIVNYFFIIFRNAHCQQKSS